MKVMALSRQGSYFQTQRVEQALEESHLLHGLYPYANLINESWHIPGRFCPIVLWYQCHSVARTRTQRQPVVIKKKALHIGRAAREVQAERGTGVVNVDRFSAQHVLCVHLSCAQLMEQTLNQDQVTTYG